MHVARMLITGNGRTFIQQEKGADIHSQYGLIKGEVIDAAEDGSVVQSETGEHFVVYSPQFIDRYKRIRRDAQIITFKDAGVILATAGIGPETTVCEAGSGSGAMTAFLARHAKHVYSYDVDPQHLALAKENCEYLGLSNTTFRLHDVTTGLPDTPIDVLLLDMPEPWHVFAHRSALRVGGYIVTYTPSTTQLQMVRNEADRVGLTHIRSVEVTERHWMVRGEAIRPTSRNTAFTAFLCFFRYFGEHWNTIRPKKKERVDGPALPSEKLMTEIFD